MKKIYNYLIGALVATGMFCSCNNWHGEKELSITNIIKWGAPVLEGIQVWLME